MAYELVPDCPPCLECGSITVANGAERRCLSCDAVQHLEVEKMRGTWDVPCQWEHCGRIAMFTMQVGTIAYRLCDYHGSRSYHPNSEIRPFDPRPIPAYWMAL